MLQHCWCYWFCPPADDLGGWVPDAKMLVDLSSGGLFSLCDGPRLLSSMLALWIQIYALDAVAVSGLETCCGCMEAALVVAVLLLVNLEWAVLGERTFMLLIDAAAAVVGDGTALGAAAGNVAC
ncbi:hypothetical protein Nepgr_002706 [Nepenthes gracilis]|uniref:Uncharacterized protein n=1 Tax=Nepenthes gracilis TaxID=150966 RepID=A0AAD3P7J8_NEPGR|nr:hypothetical protein Nepgr_002706 [Nepenthes gracilis]